MEGFITPRKVAETSIHLHGFEGCHGESFAVSNRASLEFLAFAASVSSKSSIKIAYPERNGMGKRRWSQFKVPTARRLYDIFKLSRDLIR